LVQDWIVTNNSEFIGNVEWPSNSPDANSLDYHICGVMLEHCKTFYSKSKNTDGLKKESLAVNMKPAAAVLTQQGHIEFHETH